MTTTKHTTITRRGDGITARAYRERPELAQRVVRRFYVQGFQLAFEYFASEATALAELRTFFRRWLREDGECE